MRHLGWLLSDVVSGIGRTVGKAPGADGLNVAAAHALAWLQVDNITDLVVGYSEGLTRRHAAEVILFGYLSGTRIWLIMDGELPEAAHVVATDFGIPVSDEQTFRQAAQSLRAQASPRSHRAHRSAEEPFPRLPPDDVTSFLASCREEMSDAEFQLVRTAFDRGFSAVEGVTSGDIDSTTAALKTAVETARGGAEALAVARGFQAALFRRGTYLTIDTDLFKRQTLLEPAGNQLTPDQWRELHRLARPRLAAAAALAASGLSVTEIVGLPAEAVAPNGSTVQIKRGDTLEVPLEAQRLLRAQHIFRSTLSDVSNSAFLSGARKEPKVNERWVSMTLRAVAEWTGVPLRCSKSNWMRDLAAWRRHRGIITVTLI